MQKDLAKTLRRIAEQGPDAFYKGAIAELIAAEMKRGGGLITTEDLAAYEAKARKPIHGTYRGYDVYGPPPPSSGGICLVEMLNILENFDLRKQGRFSPETLHLMIEAMRRAYCDRARYLGDPDFVKIPAFLTSKDYARKLAQSHRSEQGDAQRGPGQGHPAQRRGRQHHALLASSTATAWPWPTPTRWSAATARASSSRGPASCSTTR